MFDAVFLTVLAIIMCWPGLPIILALSFGAGIVTQNKLGCAFGVVAFVAYLAACVIAVYYAVSAWLIL
jgi:hypothetical protein